ncbi:hypothetical protein BGZ68_006113 [Mortierella alpina]|nr:hypothetical protein BGZ68_006113 [Mortierella alpina]
MTTVYPDDTFLSRAIATGPPSNYRITQETAGTLNEAGNVWAFAVTSQNAVQAVQETLSKQLDPGATLASVKRVGFKTINSRNPFDRPSTNEASTVTTDEIPSIDNGDQLVDFLVSLDWPTAADAKAKVFEPVLWFLTGETRMKTLAEKLSAHRKPFLEVVVYKTGPRPGFEQALAAWLERTSKGTSAEEANGGTQRTNTLWLAGFSPRGVDLSIPTFRKFLADSRYAAGMVDLHTINTRATTTVKWAAIGTTTAKRISEHLTQLHTTTGPGASSIYVGSEVAVAKAPNPIALAQAMVSGTLCPKVPQ